MPHAAFPCAQSISRCCSHPRTVWMFQCRTRHFPVHNATEADKIIASLKFQCRTRHFPVHNSIPGEPTGMLGLKLKIISSGCFSQKPPNISWTLFPKSRKTIRKPLQQRLPLVHENIQLTTAIFHGSQQPSL